MERAGWEAVQFTPGGQQGESQSPAWPERPGQRRAGLLEARPGRPGVGAEAPQAKCEPAAKTGALQLDGAGKAYLMKELWKRLLER